MGSSGERNRQAIDASVGGLVWVRRRNGWWPGRIMELDEVPDSSLVSPKAGTPIKLLCRDDASVAWYNLEKSKRVKAFHCRDYDALIGKAKIAVDSAKKAVKCSRRKNAILLALDIERVHLDEEPSGIDTQKRNSHNEEALSRSVSTKDHNSTIDARYSEDESDSAPELLQSLISFEEPFHMKRRRTPNDLEEDGAEGIKRTRELQDLGMVIGSKPKGLLEQVKQETVLPSDVKPNGSLSNGSAISSTKVCVSSSKRIRSRCSNQNESLKPNHRRQPLTKVLEGTAMVSDRITCNQFGASDGSPNKGLSGSKLSGFESHESMEGLSAAVNNNSDSAGISCEKVTSSNAFEFVSYKKVKDGEISCISVWAENCFCSRLFDVPLVEEEKYYAGFASAFTSYSPGRTLVVELGRQSDIGNHAESAHATMSAAHVNGDVRGVQKSGLDWQPKGKRNSRKLTETDEPDNEFPQCTVTVHKQNLCVSPTSFNGMHDFTESSSLYDVKIEDEASFKPKNLQLVSLMSNLIGKAIVGYLLTVEVLEDGFSDHLINSKDYNLTEVPIVVAYDLDQAIRATSKKHMKRKMRKSQLPPRKSSKSMKSIKRASLSKNTRRLSSVTSLKPGGRRKKLILKKQKDPVVACMPLKLVFSRINDAMNGPSRQEQRPFLSSACT